MFKEFGNYIIYSNGTIWSNKRKIFLKPRFSHKGYAHVRLHGKTFYIHKLIGKLFIPNLDNLPQISHENNDKKDNSVENLKWCTGSYNMEKAFKDGLNIPNKGSKNGASILSEKDVFEIKYKLTHLKESQLAKLFNVSTRTIGRIRSNTHWKHV
jgi:hypothetical protein